MYQQKYKKIKNKYLKLKHKMKGSSYITNEDFPEIEQEDDYFTDDRLIKPSEELFPFYIKDEEKDTVEIKNIDGPKPVPNLPEEPKIRDVGIFGLARGISEKKYNLKEIDFIKWKDKADKNKILIIDNIEDFDDFTYKYGALDKYKIADQVYGDQTVLYIKWNEVKKDYKGLYLDEGIKEERYNEAYFNGKLYDSWWQLEFDFDDTLIFKEDKMELFIGKSITIPFKAILYKENDFPANNYIDIAQGPDPDKIIKIDNFKSFDIFTNKYGNLEKLKKGTYVITIDWNKVNIDYKGFYIDKDSDIFDKRYLKAFYNGKKYESWWYYYKIKIGIVYIFV